MHFPFPSRDEPPSSTNNSRKSHDECYNRNQISHPSSSSSSCGEDDPFTAMRRFVDHQFSSFFGSFNPFASFDEFFNDDRRERALRQQRQCDELRRRIYEEMEGRTGNGNEKFDQRESRNDQTVYHGDERREWANQGIRDFYGSSPRTLEAVNEGRAETGEENSGKNGWRKWWCDRHSENDNPGDLKPKGPWASQCPKIRRDEQRGRASGHSSTGGGTAGHDDGQGQSFTQPGYVRIIPETFPLFYSRQYLLNSPYSPLYLELDYRLSNIRWRAAYEELLQTEHGVILKGASHGADNRSVQQDPMRWVQRVLGSRMISKTSNSPLLIWSNENRGGQFNSQKQRQQGLVALDDGLKQREKQQQDSQILRALTEAEGKANNDQYQYQRQRQHQRQRQAEAQYEDLQSDAYEQFLNEYNTDPHHSRDERPAVDTQPKIQNTDTSPKSPMSKSSAASTPNPSVTRSQPSNNDQTKAPISLLTTTERRVLPDGTVTTKTILKRRFGDGSEETTENESTSLLGREDREDKKYFTNKNNTSTVAAFNSNSNSNNISAWDENSEWPTSLAKFGLSGSGSGLLNDFRSSESGLNHGIDIGLYDDVVAAEIEGNGFSKHQQSDQAKRDKRERIKSNGKGEKVNVDENNNDDSAEWKSWFWSKK